MSAYVLSYSRIPRRSSRFVLAKSDTMDIWDLHTAEKCPCERIQSEQNTKKEKNGTSTTKHDSHPTPPLDTWLQPKAKKRDVKAKILHFFCLGIPRQILKDLRKIQGRGGEEPAFKHDRIRMCTAYLVLQHLRCHVPRGPSNATRHIVMLLLCVCG